MLKAAQIVENIANIRVPVIAAVEGRALLVRRGVRGSTLTEVGKEYLQSCRRALRILMDGRDFLSEKRLSPSGLIKIVCPIMMGRNILSPLLREFLNRYADLRVEIEAYASNWVQEPRADVD